ncbi:uncharacterized protein [Coffea arabica]|uniref:Retrovirus-related Pol polyprotein from transposon TNT 1-94 n=1 Tax=Coffea arabica TaxID=13443 RepID=A0ABM4UFP6_COFAR
MEAYLGGNDLWEAIEDDYEVLPLPNNPIVSQMRHHNERRQGKSKARTSLYAAVTSTIFTRIMTLKMKMKGSETIKDYSDRLLDIVNKVRLGTDFSDSRIVQKILVTFPEKFEAIIAALENSKDLPSITLAELLNALQAQEQRRLMRQERSMESAIQAISQNNNRGKNKNNQKVPRNNKSQLAHVEKICKSQQQQGEAKAAVNQPQEEQLFAVSCFATNSSMESWLIDSGSSNHMTFDRELFKKLDKTAITRVLIGNGAYLAVKGIGTMAIEGYIDSGIEHQLKALYTPQQNGVVERKNRTLMEMTRCLLHDKGLPKKFWVEAMNTVKIDKLDKKVELGIFVGYCSSSKAYRIYSPLSNKIIMSMDVKFLEPNSWSWENKDKFELQVWNDNVDEEPVRGTRLLSDIYQRCNVAVMEPTGYKEIATDQKWIVAMKEELKMTDKNQTWELVDRPTHKKVIGVKWACRTKFNSIGFVNKHKARIIVKGHAQMFGVDFSETFAPAARLDTIRILLALATQKG